MFQTAGMQAATPDELGSLGRAFGVRDWGLRVCVSASRLVFGIVGFRALGSHGSGHIVPTIC